MVETIQPLQRNFWWKVGLLAALLLWVYAPAFWWMADRWWAADSYYSHGLLIPFISAGLLWQKRHELAGCAFASSRWGFFLIVLGLLLQIFSAVWRIYFASAFSLLIVLAGLVLAVGGIPLWEKVWFPWAFLLFMIPMPLALIAQASLQLKLWAASASARVVQWFGIPVMQDGSVLYLPHGTVLVEDLCSGLRSMIALVALGVLFTYLTKTTRAKRFLLLAATVPIAVGANILRISIVSLVSEVYGYQWATGIFHDALGFVAFFFAFGLLWLLSRWLR